MAEILVVDDKPEVRKSFEHLLKLEGYEVRTAPNGDKALEAILIRKPDLVLLDIDMPKRNGFSTCAEIRKFDQLLPVLFLTGYDSDANELRARGLGADDFFSKTADVSVILATIHRTLARSQAMVVHGPAKAADKLVVGEAVVDLSSLEVAVEGRTIARLTKTEMDLLKILASDRGRNFSTDELIAGLRGEGFVCEDTMLYVHVSGLRRKLGPAGDSIVSIRREGYHLSRV